MTIESITETSRQVRSYLDGLKWDGKSRVNRWLITYLGAEDTQDHRINGISWLFGAVNRAYEPGCPIDGILVLEGKQGIGKSTVLKTLAAPWYGETEFDILDNQMYLIMKNRWVVNIGEVDSLSKSAAAKIKQFFAATEDTFRPAYFGSKITVQRHCVFAGTVNSAYLRDSGSRRFWPVPCGAIDLEGLSRDKDQLWAEAVTLYRSVLQSPSAMLDC